MVDNIKEEELQEVDGSGDIIIRHIPRHAEADIECPFCGKVNHAMFDRHTAISPYQEYDSCGVCQGYFDGNCDGKIIFSFNDAQFHYIH